jgi:TANFOR domain-containing protein
MNAFYPPTARRRGRPWLVRLLRRLGLLPVLALLLARPAAAQTDVRLTVLVLPPYSTHLSDYVDQPNRLVVTLTNTTRSPLSLQLTGTLTGDNGVRVQTGPQARSPRPVTLNALQTRTLDRDELGQLFDESQLQYTGITAREVVRGNGLPEGTYTFCVRALDYNSRRPLSAESPLGCSRSFLLRSLEPPIIVRPLADEVVKTQSPQNILFTWTRPAGAAPSTEYELRIVEMSDARRNPNDAFLAGTVPPLFERTVTGVTTLLYGPGEPALIPGRRYAFAVTARDPQGRSAFRNNGRSEVSTFRYGAAPATPAQPAASSPAAPPKSSKKADLTPKTDLLPTAIIRGRLLWGWRASEETNLTLPPTPGLSADVSGSAWAAANDPSAGPGGSAALGGAVKAAGSNSPNAGKNGSKPSAGAGSNASASPGGGTTVQLSAITTSTLGGANAQSLAHTSLVSGGGQTTGASIAGSLTGGGQLAAGLGSGPQSSSANDLPTIGSAPAAQLPTVLGSSRFPLAHQKIKLVFDYHRIAKGQMGWNDPLLNPEEHEVLGIGTTDAEGNFAIGILSGFDASAGYPQLVKGSRTYLINRLRVEVANPHFYDEPVGYDLKAAEGGYSLGDALCLARSYRLRLNVLDAAGKPATGPIQVQLLRQSSWYGPRSYARPEGQLPTDNRPTYNLDNPNSAAKGEFTIVTQLSSGADKELLRLLANATGPTDQYLLTLRVDGYSDFTTSLAVQPAGTSWSDGVVTITKTYTLNSKPPQVRGRVLRKHDSSPLAGANIRLASTNNSGGKVYTTQTDAQGRFVISLTGVTMAPMTLAVLPGPGVEKGWKEDNLKLNKPGPAGIITRDPILIDATQHPVAGRVLSDAGGGVAQANLHWKSGGAPFQTDAEGRFLTTHQAGADTLVISKLGFAELRAGVWINGDGLTNPQTGKKGNGTTLVLGPATTPKALKNAASDLSKTFGKISSLQVDGAAPFQLPGSGNLSGAGGNLGAGNLGGSIPGGGKNAGSSAGTSGNSGAGSSSGTATPGALSGSQYAGGSLADEGALSGYLQSIGATGPVGEGQDLGQFTLRKLVGRLRVTVLDSASAKLLAGAAVTFPAATPALSQTTGADGKTYFDKAPGGPGSLRISGPAGGPVAYVPALLDVTIPADGSVTELTVRLAPGTRVQGTVTSGGQPVAGAKVRVLGRPDLETTTSPAGQYELTGVPKGAWTLEAAKSGLVGQSQTQTFKPGQNATVDFVLTSAGFAIDKLLGFPIEVKKLTLGADTTLSGAFVNLPANGIFAAASGARLEFANVPVRLGKTGLLRPKGQDFVLTDATELPLTAFKYLPVKLTAPAGLKVQMNGSPAKGQLAGQVEINYAAWTPGLGWAWTEGAKTYLSDAAGTGALPPLPVLRSDSNLPLPALRLRAPVKSVGLTLYGFTASVDLLQSTVGADGLHLVGSVQLQGIPALGAATIQVPQLWIAPDGAVKTAALDFTPPVSLSVGGFGFTLSGGSLSEAGFKLSGAVKVQAPASAPSTVSFTDLAIGSGQLYGGNFSLPSAGLDVFGLAKFKPVAGVPLAFGTLPGGGPAFFSGGARTTLPLLDKTLTIESFTVRSDGQFSAQVPADYDTDFAGLAKMHLTAVKFNAIGTVGIDVIGQVRLQLPLVKAEVGNLRYRVGQAPALDNVGLHVPIGVGELGGSVSFKNNGFGGALDMNLVSVMKVKTAFNYQKVAGDVQFDAKIQTGIPPVPIGPGLALSSIGGGLGYGAGTLKKVSVSGVVSVVGFEAGLALNPIEVTVTPGPVIVGTADLTVFEQKMAKAALTLDFPNSLASVQIQTDYQPLPGMSTASAGGIVVVSGKSGDSYWVMGLGAQAKMLGLLDVNANVLVGQNLNVTQHPELSDYTSFVDKAYLSNGTTVNGAHLQGYSHFGRHENDAFEKCFWKACGKIWYYNDALATLNANFASHSYGLSVASGWGGGAALSVAGKSLAGADVGANGALGGSYNPSQGWNINGTVGAHLTGWLGSCSDACANKICWGGCFNACFVGCEVCPIPVGLKVCVHPGLKVDYSSNSGMSMGLDL